MLNFTVITQSHTCILISHTQFDVTFDWHCLTHLDLHKLAPKGYDQRVCGCGIHLQQPAFPLQHNNIAMTSIVAGGILHQDCFTEQVACVSMRALPQNQSVWTASPPIISLHHNRHCWMPCTETALLAARHVIWHVTFDLVVRHAHCTK